MQRRTLLGSAAGAALALGLAVPASGQTTLNVITAGSENMVDYVTDFLAPKFEALHPDIKINVTGTGPGDAGSQLIYEKLDAQKKELARVAAREEVIKQWRDEAGKGDAMARMFLDVYDAVSGRPPAP